MTPAAGTHVDLLLMASLLPPFLTFITSSDCTRPFGPEPCTVFKSIPSSVANFLARPLAMTRSSVKLIGSVGVGAAGEGGRVVAGVSKPSNEYFWIFSMSASFETITAQVAPTLAELPSSTTIIAKYPSSNTSYSMSALSDSTTIIASPLFTLSPTDFKYCTIFPSVIVDDKAGIAISENSISVGLFEELSIGLASWTVSEGEFLVRPSPLATALMSSLFSTIMPTVEPTFVVSPSFTNIEAKYPPSNDSTSMSALSDSTTMTASPEFISSPTSLSHCTIFPSVIVEDSAGIDIS
mmetsp:Transcript_9331/g.14048  ORF Transcript_9331/g.14048 Transcript_9331/m.14048 type:complete len:295 (+) Transcript_9331:902-1786(+)